MGMSNLSEDVRNLLVRRWYMAELGRVPKAEEQAAWAKELALKGVDQVFAFIYDSPEAKAYRIRVGRKI